MSLARSIAAGAAAGLLAGGLVGFHEGAVIFAANPSSAATAPLYGTLFYGVLLAIFGPGAGVAAWILSRILDKARPIERGPQRDTRWVWWMALIAMLLPTALVVARFRIVRDVFNEKLPIASGAGIGVHVGLLVGAAVLAGAVYALCRRGGPLTKLKWPVLTGAGFAAIALIAAPFMFLGGSKADSMPKVTAAADKPPVIVLMIDTLRADHLTSYGYSKNTSPNMAAFARDAVQFDHNFAQASWTRPSVASIMTSLPPSAHKTMYKNDRLPDGTIGMGEAFKAAGYRTGGLVTNYNIAPYFNFDQGFDDYRYLEPDFYFWANEGSSRLSLYQLVRIVREKVAPAKSSPSFYYQDAERTTDEAIAWIDTHKDAPFYLFVSYMDPHDPYFARPLNGEAYSRAEKVNPDPKMRERFIELYDQEINYFDTHFGRLVAHLKKQGLYDKAVIVITSDHGEEFQDHGGWWHGTTLYDEQTHVPLIVKRSGGKDANTHRDELTELIDIAPTVAAEAGLPPQEAWHGRALFSGAKPLDAVFSENDHQGNDLKALRSKTWKLIRANAGNPRGLAENELFDLDKDADEKTNLAGTNAEMLKTMGDALTDAASNAGKTTLKIERDTHEIDDDSKARLEALGYIDTDAPPPPKSETPKDGEKKDDAKPEGDAKQDDAEKKDDAK